MTRTMRYIAIVGSRCARRDDVVNAFKTCKLSPLHHVIVSGGARGADYWAKDIAKEWGFHYVEVPPFWERGLMSGFARNTIIVDICDAMVAVWDGNSTGTKDSIDKAREAGKKVEIIAAMLGMAAAEEAAPKLNRKRSKKVSVDE